MIYCGSQIQVHRNLEFFGPTINNSTYSLDASVQGMMQNNQTGNTVSKLCLAITEKRDE